MNDRTISAIVSVIIGLVGVAIVAELVSKQSNTPSVLTSFGQSLQQMFCVALSPITGNNCGNSISTAVDSVFHTCLPGDPKYPNC